jgi:hypothetical protein
VSVKLPFSAALPRPPLRLGLRAQLIVARIRRRLRSRHPSPPTRTLTHLTHHILPTMAAQAQQFQQKAEYFVAQVRAACPARCAPRLPPYRAQPARRPGLCCCRVLC